MLGHHTSIEVGMTEPAQTTLNCYTKAPNESKLKNKFFEEKLSRITSKSKTFPVKQRVISVSKQFYLIPNISATCPTLHMPNPQKWHLLTITDFQNKQLNPISKKKFTINKIK